MTTEQERAAFEWWASDEGESPRSVERAGECYKLAQIQSYWMAWQARAALQAQDREDVKRLDWLDKAAHCADWMEGEPTKRVIRAHDGAEFTGDTWREAIDHARRIEGDGE